MANPSWNPRKIGWSLGKDSSTTGRQHWDNWLPRQSTQRGSCPAKKKCVFCGCSTPALGPNQCGGSLLSLISENEIHVHILTLRKWRSTFGNNKTVSNIWQGFFAHGHWTWLVKCSCEKKTISPPKLMVQNKQPPVQWIRGDSGFSPYPVHQRRTNGMPHTGSWLCLAERKDHCVTINLQQLGVYPQKHSVY
jgi:hypothetical protein